MQRSDPALRGRSSSARACGGRVRADQRQDRSGEARLRSAFGKAAYSWTLRPLGQGSRQKSSSLSVSRGDCSRSGSSPPFLISPAPRQVAPTGESSLCMSFANCPAIKPSDHSAGSIMCRRAGGGFASLTGCLGCNGDPEAYGLRLCRHL